MLVRGRIFFLMLLYKRKEAASAAMSGLPLI